MKITITIEVEMTPDNNISAHAIKQVFDNTTGNVQEYVEIQKSDILKRLPGARIDVSSVIDQLWKYVGVEGNFMIYESESGDIDKIPFKETSKRSA